MRSRAIIAQWRRTFFLIVTVIHDVEEDLQQSLKLVKRNEKRFSRYSTESRSIESIDNWNIQIGEPPRQR